MNPFLEMRDITKRFPGVLANDHVNLTIEAGEIHALLGENGAGKSTLMQVLYGLYHPDAGEIRILDTPVHIHGPHDAIALGVGMIHQEFMLIPRFSVVENVVMGMEKAGSGPLLDLEAAAASLAELSRLHGLAVDPRARVEHLSVGVQQRVEILKLLYRNARLLILDEPTAVLTPQEVHGLFEVLRSLKQEGRSVIFITHKLHEVMEVADRVTVMRDGKVMATVPIHMTDAPALARMMVGREVLLRANKVAQAPGEAVLRFEDLHVQDDNGQIQVRGINLAVHAGEIVGLAGVDGNGQSQLAEAALHLRPIAQGRVILNGKDITNLSPAAHRSAGMAYIPADRRQVGSVGALSIAYNAILGNIRRYTTAAHTLLSTQRINAQAQAIVERFDVRTPGIHFEAGKLSGGNLQKVVLGRELMRQPRALVVEQPTRGLDVGATEFVQRQLLDERARGAAILLISAELEEIMALSDRIAVIYKGEIMGIVDPGTTDVETIGLMMAGTRGTQPHKEQAGDD